MIFNRLKQFATRIIPNLWQIADVPNAKLPYVTSKSTTTILCCKPTAIIITSPFVDASSNIN
jgi:hypothetical protein